MYRYFYLLLFPLSMFLFSTCATPVAPQGGPPDRTPPEIVETSPEPETVNFDGRRFRVEFSKWMNRGNFHDAVSVEPDLGIPFEISWRRRTATIEFERDLPEETTVIIRIGTEAADTRGNNLASSFILAVSTGSEIDDGQIQGRILRASDGRTDSGYRVFLYREPFELSEQANYVAETDTGGTVTFSYLSPGTYKALYVEDLNRNRVWDEERERAQPFHEESFELEREGEYDLGTIFIDRPDTTRPRLQGVGLLTENRLRLRFNEPIYWEDEARIEVQDTLDQSLFDAWPLYTPPDDEYVLFAQSDEPFEEESWYQVALYGLHDEAGNPARVSMDPFEGSSEPDTVALRIIGDNRDPGLFREESLEVGYSKFIDDDNVLDSLKVVVGEEMIEPWPHAEIDRHRLRVYPEGDEWESGVRYQFLVWNPYLEQLRPIEPTIWQNRQLGEIEITLTDPDDDLEHVLILFDEEGKLEIRETFTGSATIENLPPLRYTLMVFRDDDGSGSWDSGSVIPFEAPEPYFVQTDLPVTEGFTSEIEVSFRDQRGMHAGELEPLDLPDPDPDPEVELPEFPEESPREAEESNDPDDENPGVEGQNRETENESDQER